MFKKFISYYKPHKKMFFLDLLAAFLISICDLFYPILTRSILYDFIPNRKINVKLSDEEIARRKAELKPYEPNVKGYLKRYAAHVSSAASGAIYVE